MFNIAVKQASIYTDISSGKNKVTKKAGFNAYEKSNVSQNYDLRTNESKMQKIKMREIRDND